MSRFSESAKRAVERSRVTTGRDKMTLEDVIKNYPDGVCVDEFQILVGESGKEYVVMHIKDTNNYFNGGSIALKIARGWIDDFAGDEDTASEELKKDGGCTFRITRGTTKKGQPITFFDAID